MNNDEDEEPHRPGTSRDELSDQKPPECPRESSRLNNNIVTGRDASKCCAHCDTAAQQDHMIAISLVHVDQEDSDSDVDDDRFIYTYRGDRLEPVVDNIPAEDRNSSPLMDYLEMDFDPEPAAVGPESEDEADANVLQRTITITHINEPMQMNMEEPIPSGSNVNSAVNHEQEEQATSERNTTDEVISVPVRLTSLSITITGNSISCPIPEIRPQRVDRIIEERERNGCLRRNADTMEVCQKLKRMRVDDISWVKEMVWSENDARQHQIGQLGISACGATAVVNTLLALRIPFNVDNINKTIDTHLRDETASLIPYLESRAVAGCMPQDMVRTLESVTDSQVTARFFAAHQNLELPIAPWLAGWIKKGAVPILTLNRQRIKPVPNSLVPDSWHHQMMYGITYNPLCPECAHVYLTNPLSKLTMETLRPQLLSPSTLMIRRDDVLSRWTPQTDLMPLVTHPNQQWRRLNVLGQVVNLLREANEYVQFTEHIVIPANYQSGITLAMKTSSNYSHELKSVPEL